MMDNLSPDVQMKVFEYLIAQEQLPKESSNAGYFFAVLLTFVFGFMLGAIVSRKGWG